MTNRYTMLNVQLNVNVPSLTRIVYTPEEKTRPVNRSWELHLAKHGKLLQLDLPALNCRIIRTHCIREPYNYTPKTRFPRTPVDMQHRMARNERVSCRGAIASILSVGSSPRRGSKEKKETSSHGRMVTTIHTWCTVASIYTLPSSGARTTF